MVTIVDYNMGNLRSIIKAFHRLDIDVKVASSPEEIRKADRLVLPGVGNFATGMTRLETLGLVDALNTAVMERRVPILGICLGMQLFTGFSEERQRAGLNWLTAETKKFSFLENSKLKVPHIGWNNVRVVRSSKLFEGIDENASFYFVHSYYVVCGHRENVLAETEYGVTFVSCMQRDNILGVQFHPEKSHSYGLAILENFAERF